MKQAELLRELLSGDEMIVAPGAYDCLTARLIEQAGFPAVYMTGAGVSASLGYPDYGLTTMTEMVDRAGRMAQAVDIPIIADADTGYGNELNVVRTVREHESRGVAGIHIEDQVSPKRCGHLEGKELVGREDFLAKIAAASQNKTDPSFVVIARTDARAVMGLDEAIRRANEALEIGADLAFVEAPQTMEEVREIPRRVMGACLLNMARGGKTPTVSLEEARCFGYRIAILPGILVSHVISTCDGALEKLKESGQVPVPDRELSLQERFQRLGSETWNRYRSSGSDPLAPANRNQATSARAETS